MTLNGGLLREFCNRVWEANDPIEMYIGRANWVGSQLTEIICVISGEEVNVLPFCQYRCYRMSNLRLHRGNLFNYFFPAVHRSSPANEYIPEVHEHPGFEEGWIRIESESRPANIIVLKTQKPVTWVIIGGA